MRRSVLAAVICLTASSCSPLPFAFEVAGSLEEPVLTLKVPGLFKERLCLRHIGVIRRDAGASPPDRDWVWRAAVPAGQSDCVASATIRYGQEVPGFESLVAPAALVAGQDYELIGGTSARSGWVVVRFEEGRWIEVPR